MARIGILGGGMVGSAMAMDLSVDHDVTVVDRRPEALERVKSRYGVRGVQADLGDPAAVRQVVADFDVVLGAISSVIGLQTLRAVIEAGKRYCDVSFMPEDATELAPLARDRGAVAVVDCGVAPGVSNLWAGHAAGTLDPCEKLDIMVGGLPVERRWPYEYKAGFAPSDVIEEYTRPARQVEHGQVVVRAALSSPELVDFEGVGTLEAFDTDGLRSLIKTLRVPDMQEKTLRYPGHIELMRVLRETGFFSKELIDVGGQKVRPLDVTSALMFPKWSFGEGEADLTVLRVEAEGKKNGVPTRLRYDLSDRYDPKTNLRSMSRTTAFPACIFARLLADGKFTPGVHPPETLAMQPGIFEHVMRELDRRGIHTSFRTEKI